MALVLKRKAGEGFTISHPSGTIHVKLEGDFCCCKAVVSGPRDALILRDELVSMADPDDLSLGE